MELITTVSTLRERVRAARREGALIGVVPTMGAFHEGHLSLMRRAKAECGLVVVTLFVNPTQFGPNEDFTRYPRDLDTDRALAETTGADVLFAPEVEEVYPGGKAASATVVSVSGLTCGLCGASRPGHFDGVSTVVSKLFNMVLPDRAYFGEKDYQQLQVIQRMTRDLNFPLQIIPCPTYREADGLAMSSRNRYLSPEERQTALRLSRALKATRLRFTHGERSVEALRNVARQELEDPGVRVDYLELVDGESLEEIQTIEQPAVLALAAFVGRTRLIDNTVLDPASLSPDLPDPEAPQAAP